MGGGKGFSSRRQARRVALQALYEIDAVGHSWSACVERLLEESSLSESAASFVQTLVQGVLTNLREIDRTIERFAPSWPLSQLAIVDRNVLRIAVFELTLSDETPPKAVINEAVELAKLFGSENSPKFINGVLGSVLEETKSIESRR